MNCGSLRLNQGSHFDFLGVNGVGKITPIKMITSMLFPSDGTVETFARDISRNNAPTIMSTYPQFNIHLCEELPPCEHFTLYSLFSQCSVGDTAIGSG
jgi:ABC-type multidrug transport system ATPase subunit